MRLLSVDARHILTLTSVSASLGHPVSPGQQGQQGYLTCTLAANCRHYQGYLLTN